MHVFGLRVHEHLAKLKGSFSKYDLSPEDTLKIERVLNCLLFYSSTIIDNTQEESSVSWSCGLQSVETKIRKPHPYSLRSVADGLNKHTVIWQCKLTGLTAPGGAAGSTDVSALDEHDPNEVTGAENAVVKKDDDDDDCGTGH